jgi:hypothetical protein
MRYKFPLASGFVAIEARGIYTYLSVFVTR